jgi:hypothetical protein
VRVTASNASHVSHNASVECLSHRHVRDKARMSCAVQNCVSEHANAEIRSVTPCRKRSMVGPRSPRVLSGSLVVVGSMQGVGSVALLHNTRITTPHRTLFVSYYFRRCKATLIRHWVRVLSKWALLRLLLFQGIRCSMPLLGCVTPPKSRPLSKGCMPRPLLLARPSL